MIAFCIYIPFCEFHNPEFTYYYTIKAHGELIYTKKEERAVAK